jgi:hypothetical protein
MSQQGPNNPTAAQSETGPGTAWTNAAGVEGSTTNAVANIPGTGDSSNTLYGSSFGFTIPGGSTIVGIKMGFTRKCLNNFIQDTGVFVSNNTDGTSSNEANTGVNWTTTSTQSNYGGNTNLIGNTWSVAGVNSSSMGLQLSVEAVGGADEAEVMNMYMTIFYTAATGGPMKSQTCITKPHIAHFQ